jgi:hypothetical protein
MQMRARPVRTNGEINHLVQPRYQRSRTEECEIRSPECYGRTGQYGGSRDISAFWLLFSVVMVFCRSQANLPSSGPSIAGEQASREGS